MEKVKCTHCNGKGIHPVGFRAEVGCDICEGTGKMKSEWEEEFEAKMYQAKETYGGVYLVASFEEDTAQLEKLVVKYLGVPNEDQEEGKVKIKARKGKIVIERINLSETT